MISILSDKRRKDNTFETRSSLAGWSMLNNLCASIKHMQFTVYVYVQHCVQFNRLYGFLAHIHHIYTLAEFSLFTIGRTGSPTCTRISYWGWMKIFYRQDGPSDAQSTMSKNKRLHIYTAQINYSIAISLKSSTHHCIAYMAP